MIEQDEKIRKGLSPRRDEACFQLQRDIVIPAGTILRQADAKRGGEGSFACPVGIGLGFVAHFAIEDRPGAVLPPAIRRVVA